MKKRIIPRIAAATMLLLVACFGALSFTSRKMAGDIWKQLGLTEEEGKHNISNSFFSGYLQFFGVRNIKNIVAGDRAAVASDLLSYVKQYVSAASFAKEYQQFRESEKRRILPVQPAVTREQLTKKKIAETEATLKTFNDLLQTTMDASLKKSYQEQADFWKKALADYKTPGNAQVNYELQMDETRYKNEKEIYDGLMKKWETNFPLSQLQFIKQRLGEFLEATKEVDFNAPLADKNGKKVFVNPAYERKNTKWKMAYRAGKEVTETARTFAIQWMKELN